MALINEHLDAVRKAYVYIRTRSKANPIDGEEIPILNGLCSLIARETGDTEKQVHAKYTKWLEENTQP